MQATALHMGIICNVHGVTYQNAVTCRIVSSSSLRLQI